MVNIIRMKITPIQQSALSTRSVKKTLLHKYPGCILIVKRTQTGLTRLYDWFNLEEATIYYDDNTIFQCSTAEYSAFDLFRCGFCGSIIPGHKHIDDEENAPRVYIGGVHDIKYHSEYASKWNSIKDPFEANTGGDN